MKIIVFTEGTLLMHKGAIGRTLKEIIEQVVNQEPSVKDYANYVPIGNAVQKIQRWVDQGGGDYLYNIKKRDA